MTLTPTLPTGSPAGLPLLAERRIWAGAVVRSADGTPRTGILPAHLSALVTGKASMGYNVAEFVAVTSRDGVGVEFLANDGTVAVDPAGYAGPLANSRLDVIWVRSRFTILQDAVETPEFGVTQGVASPTPVKPSIPAGALELAVAEVKSTDTTTQTVVITQTHRYTAMTGGTVMFRSSAEMDAWNNPMRGQRAAVLPSAREYMWNGTAWGFASPVGTTYRRSAAYNFGAPAVVIPWSSQDFSGGEVTHSVGNITVNRAGVYRVDFGVTCSQATATRIFAILRRNGSIVLIDEGVSNPTARTTLGKSITLQLAKDEVLTLETGATSTVAADPDGSRNFISITPVS